MLNIELIAIDEVDADDLQGFSCKHNNGRLEEYLRTDALNDSKDNKLYTRTHVVFDVTNNQIVGFFTISIKTFKFHRSKKKEMNIAGLHHNQGEYNTIYLHFIGLNDTYKSKYIEDTQVKYSELLMFMFLSVCYEIYESVPYAGITLYSYEDTKFLYDHYNFTYIQRDSRHKDLYLYMLPASRIPLHLSDNEEGYFLDLLELFGEEK